MFYQQQQEYPKATFKEKTQQERKYIKSIDWNCTGTYLASGDSTIKIWSFDGNNIKKFTDIKQGSEQLEKLLFHPTNPDIIASITKDYVKVWDIRNKSHIRLEKKEQLGIATWHPSGNDLAIGTKSSKESSITIMDLGGQADRTISYQPKDKDKNFELKSLQYDPLGDVLVAGGSQNNAGMIQILDGTTPELPPLECIEAHRAAITQVRFTKDGQYLLTGSADSLIMIWQLPEMLYAGSFTSVESEIKSMSINSDSKYIAAIGSEEQTYIFQIDQCIQGKNDHIDSIRLEGQGQEIVYHPTKQILGFVCYDKNKQESIIHLYGHLGA